MCKKVIIRGELKGLNELLSGRMYNFRTKKYMNPVKSENDLKCIKAIRMQLRGEKLKTPIKVIYDIYVKDKRHDRGNVYAAVEKSFLDALQKCDVLENDGWKQVLDSEFHTHVDAKQPRIQIKILEEQINET